MLGKPATRVTPPAALLFWKEKTNLLFSVYFVCMYECVQVCVWCSGSHKRALVSRSSTQTIVSHLVGAGTRPGSSARVAEPRAQLYLPFKRHLFLICVCMGRGLRTLVLLQARGGQRTT